MMSDLGYVTLDRVTLADAERAREARAAMKAAPRRVVVIEQLAQWLK